MFILKKCQLLNFGTAINRLSQLNQYDREMKKENLEADEEIKRVITAIDSQLSEIIRNDMIFFVKKYHIDQLPISVGLKENDRTIDDFIKDIRGFGPEEFKKFYRDYMFTMDATLDEIKEKIQRNEENNAISFLPTFKDYLTFERDIEVIAPRIIQSFEVVSKIYNAHWDAIFKIEEKYDEIFKKYLENQEAFAQQLYLIGRDTYDYKIKDVYVYVALFLEGYLSFNIRKEIDKLFMVVGAGLHRKILEDSQLHQEFFKCLADPTKLKIIEMMTRERVCARDIAKRLKLTKATISYHLNKLILVGILKIGLQEGKKAYYEVQLDVIQLYFDQFINNIKN